MKIGFILFGGILALGVTNKLINGFTETNPNLKIIHFVTFGFVVGFSALFGIMESNIGIIQRVMYLGSFVWLMFFYND